MNDRVAFEADDHTVAEGWSVIVKGRAHVLSASAEIEEAEQAPLLPWTATLKPHYVVIALEITGRRCDLRLMRPVAASLCHHFRG